MQAYRCLLFVPAHDERKLAKALTLDVDGLVLDLEDAVGAGAKTAAREAAAAFLRQRAGPFFVRVNPAASPYFLGDILALAGGCMAGLVLAKTESAAELDRVDWLLGLLERDRGAAPGGTEIMPFIESARALEDAAAIAGASPRVRRLLFGGNDFAASLGVAYGGPAFFHARSRLVAVSAAMGLEPPVDTVHPDFRSPRALASDARMARRMGFQGKMAIHPDQVAIIRAVFTPTPAEVAQARRVIAAFEAAAREGLAVCRLDGRMVELPMVTRARRVLAAAPPDPEH